MDANDLFESLGIADQKLKQQLSSISETKNLDKGEKLLWSGAEQTHISFVLDGIMRSALIGIDGTDATDCFILPGMAAVPSADLDAPSPGTIEALTPCEVLSIERMPLERLIESDLSLALIYNNLLKQAWRDHWAVKTATQQTSARERYLWFLQEYPGVIDRVPHRYVASFLGVTPVTLSRVRHSL